MTFNIQMHVDHQFCKKGTTTIHLGIKVIWRESLRMCTKGNRENFVTYKNCSSYGNLLKGFSIVELEA
jgi:hypothetical protein